MSDNDNLLLWPPAHYDKIDDMKALCQGILKSLDKKKTSPSCLQLVGRLSKYDPEKTSVPTML